MASTVEGGQVHTCGLQTFAFTSWTDKNPGRRFERCERYKQPGGCKYWKWNDLEFTARSVELINGFRTCNLALSQENHRLRDLQMENQSLRAELKAVRSELDMKENLCLETHVAVQLRGQAKDVINTESSSTVVESHVTDDTFYRSAAPDVSNVGGHVGMNESENQHVLNTMIMAMSFAFLVGFMVSAKIN